MTNRLTALLALPPLLLCLATTGCSSVATASNLPPVPALAASTDQGSLSPQIAAAYSIDSNSAAVAATSSLSASDAQKVANLICAVRPGTSVCNVLPTGSMKPSFSEKVLLLTEQARFDDLRVGDIVTYKNLWIGGAVVHRLIRKDGERFWVKGDANDHADGVYVTRDNYINRVFGMIYTR
jgi:signal peptidase I